MKVLVTGSSGHLGEALMRLLPGLGHDAVGLDLTPSPFTHHVGSILDRGLLRDALVGVESVIHTATLHKPHVDAHPKRAFVETNVLGSLAVLEETAAAGAASLVFTSTTSAFGAALTPPPGAPAVWIDESVAPVARNIYGATKVAAEDLCALHAREGRLACVVLRTSRFFPEPDDDAAIRTRFADANLKANELLFRRVDVEDAAQAHALAMVRAPELRFARYVISAPSPFTRADLAALRRDPAAVVADRHPGFPAIYAALGFRMFDDISRVYVSDRARSELGWRPKHDFGSALRRLAAGAPIGSDLARKIGVKGYGVGPLPGEAPSPPDAGLGRSAP